MDTLASVQSYRFQDPQVARLSVLEEVAHRHDLLLDGYFVTFVRAGVAIAVDSGDPQAGFEELNIHLSYLERLYGREQVLVRLLVVGIQTRVRRLLDSSILRVVAAFHAFPGDKIRVCVRVNNLLVSGLELIQKLVDRFVGVQLLLQL